MPDAGRLGAIFCTASVAVRAGARIPTYSTSKAGRRTSTWTAISIDRSSTIRWERHCATSAVARILCGRRIIYTLKPFFRTVSMSSSKFCRCAGGWASLDHLRMR